MICTKCNGFGNIRTQSGGVEVHFPTCARCLGTGKEPVGIIAKIDAFMRRQHLAPGHIEDKS